MDSFARIPSDSRRTLRIVASIVVAIAAVGVSASVARADATPEKLALKALRNEQDAAVTKFKKAVAASVSTFRDAVSDVEDQLASDGDAAAAASLVFDAIVQLQTDVTGHLADAADEQANAAVAALAGLHPGVEGVYPSAFYPGDRTEICSFEDAIEDVLAKAYHKVHKRLAKSVERFADAGANLTFRVSPPRWPTRSWLSTAADSFPVHQPTIDAVLTWSDAAATGDGKMMVSGEADYWPGVADEVLVVATFFGQQPFASVTPVSGRYTSDLDDALLAEGVWLVGATQNNSLPADVSIGVR